MKEKIENGRLTLNQVKYLTLLDKLEQKRGAVQNIADQCGVRHPTVSRFFKACVEKGYLTESYAFTEKGRRILEWNQKLEQGVREYLVTIGVNEGIDDFVRGMMENVDYNILEKTISKRVVISGTQMKKAAPIVVDVSDIMDPGEHRVRIALFRINPMERTQKSMADRGFEHYARIVHNERESYLELTVREMHAVSRMNGRETAGHLASLKFLYHGILRQAMIEDSKVCIPLDACSYEIFDHGIIWGNVNITVTCSVGAAHMPESTARLIFII